MLRILTSRSRAEEGTPRPFSATREQTKRKPHTTRTTSIDHTQWTNPARRRHAHSHPKKQRGPRLSWERVDTLASTVRQNGDDIPDGEKIARREEMATLTLP